MSSRLALGVWGVLWVLPGAAGCLLSVDLSGRPCPCGPGFVCEAEICVDTASLAPCADDGECPAGRSCQEQRCVLGGGGGPDGCPAALGAGDVCVGLPQGRFVVQEACGDDSTVTAELRERLDGVSCNINLVQRALVAVSVSGRLEVDGAAFTSTLAGSLTYLLTVPQSCTQFLECNTLGFALSQGGASASCAVAEPSGCLCDLLLPWDRSDEGTVAEDAGVLTLQGATTRTFRSCAGAVWAVAEPSGAGVGPTVLLTVD
jgi:hypothetical protein